MDPLLFVAKPSIDDLSEDYNKAAHYVATHLESKLESKDIENFIKTYTFIYQNISLNDTKVVSNNAIKYKHLATTHSTLFSHFKEIAKLPTSIANAVIVDNIIGLANRNLPYKFNVRNASGKRPSCGGIVGKRKKLYLIIKQLFLLPVSKFDLAFERVVQNVDFDILGYIFCETTSSIYYEKCIILEDKFCHLIRDNNSTILHHFMNSLFKCVSNSRRGKSLYRQCLKNKFFRESILSFFTRLKFENALSNDSALDMSLQKYVLQELLYTLVYTFENVDKTSIDGLDDFIRDLSDYMNLVFL